MPLISMSQPWTASRDYIKVKETQSRVHFVMNNRYAMLQLLPKSVQVALSNNLCCIFSFVYFLCLVVKTICRIIKIHINMQQKESLFKYFSYGMIPEEFSCNCGDLENSNLRTFMPWLALLSFPASLLLVIYLQTRACACIFYLPKCLCFHLFCSSEICL